MKFNLDFIYPIGSIYINTNEINPSMIFGGTWERIQGRYLMGAGTPSQNTYDGFGMLTANDLKLNFQPATLGEYAHTLSAQEMPSHKHNGLDWAGHPTSINAGNSAMLWSQSWSAGDAKANYWQTGYTGGSQAHNNLPPTIVVYIWKRIA